jgi:hypothetical protein
MRWIVHRQIGLNDSGVEWVRQLLGSRDTSRVDWLRIDFGRGAKRGAYGRCWYPARDRGKGYRISVQVPGPFPWTMERYTKPLYRDRDGTWPEIPDGCRLAGYCRDDRTGREWQRLTTRCMFRTVQEGSCSLAHMKCFTSCGTHARLPGETGRTRLTSSRLHSWMTFAGCRAYAQNEHSRLAAGQTQNWRAQFYRSCSHNPRRNGSGTRT